MHKWINELIVYCVVSLLADALSQTNMKLSDVFFLFSKLSNKVKCW